MRSWGRTKGTGAGGEPQGTAKPGAERLSGPCWGGKGDSGGVEAKDTDVTLSLGLCGQLVRRSDFLLCGSICPLRSPGSSATGAECSLSHSPAPRHGAAE